MELRLYDTLTKEKRAFAPLDPQNVRMYVCGPTVYDFAHIGNARPVIVFDVLFRLLRHIYGADHVKYVRNITDVDDKINARAADRGISIRELTDATYAEFKADVAALGCLPPSVEPRATEHIAEMRALIERLIANGNAYVADDHALFSVPSMPAYGKLARRSLDEMVAGARVEVAPYKRDATDFVLWKPSKPGEPSWESPGGIAAMGRPGWHIECSAMAWKHLGERFDIHGGGIDLVFPHHENEIAQTCCAFHSERMAETWMHNGFLQVEGKKMSKSDGNFVTIHELRKSRKFGGRRWSGSTLKFAMLQTHYRQPINWSVELLNQSKRRLDKWRRFASNRVEQQVNEDIFSEFVKAICDDLNTPFAFSIVDKMIEGEQDPKSSYTVYRILRFLGLTTTMSKIASLANRSFALVKSIGSLGARDFERIQISIKQRNAHSSAILRPEDRLAISMEFFGDIGRLLGSPDLKVRSSANELYNHLLMLGRPAESQFETWIRGLILDREEARRLKNWKLSDMIRDELLAKGIAIKDTKEGTTWERVK